MFSQRQRARRAEIFRRYLNPTEEDSILDLGSGDGSYIADVVCFRKNVTIADIDGETLLRGQERYGFKTELLDESGVLPFTDRHFDIVFCNSVIEHVTIDKNRKWSVLSGKEFAQLAFERQETFAAEIRRVAKNYFVQTPNRRFALESHTWLPFVQFLPRPVLVKAVNWTNSWWVKKTSPDWNLLTVEQMRKLFPGALIVEERMMGLTKSLIAISSDRA